MTITKDLLKTLRSDMDAALKIVGDKHGVVLKFGSASFSPDAATFKLEVATITSDGNVVTKEGSEFKQLASIYNLKPEHLNQKFMSAGREYTLRGLNRRAHSMPFIAECGGKMYKLPTRAVQAGFGVPVVAELPRFF